MPFVLDASIIGSWALDDEDDPVAAVALELAAKEDIFVPAVTWFEVRNMLVTNERRKRFNEKRSTLFLAQLNRMKITIDREPNEVKILALARNHNLTVYDSSYLELAIRISIPLATLGKSLISAARAENIQLISK